MCHVQGQNLVRPERSLAKENINKYLAGGFSEESIAYQIYVGKNAMPGFGSRLSVEQIQDIAAYVYKESNSDWKMGVSNK